MGKFVMGPGSVSQWENLQCQKGFLVLIFLPVIAVK
jgi:hypothetical protein